MFILRRWLFRLSWAVASKSDSRGFLDVVRSHWVKLVTWLSTSTRLAHSVNMWFSEPMLLYHSVSSHNMETSTYVDQVEIWTRVLAFTHFTIGRLHSVTIAHRKWIVRVVFPATTGPSIHPAILACGSSRSTELTEYRRCLPAFWGPAPHG